jgi:hypothetical protein
MKTFRLLVNTEGTLCLIEWKQLLYGTDHSSVFLLVDLHITCPMGVALQHLYLGIIPLSKAIGSRSIEVIQNGPFPRLLGIT